MTTPERLRARQRRDGVALILLAIFTVAQAIFFNLEDRDQRDCFQRRFQQLTAAVSIRSDLVARESAAIKGVLDVYADAAARAEDEPGQFPGPDEDEQLRQELMDALLHYQSEAQIIQDERRENPVPPFPPGSCAQVD